MIDSADAAEWNFQGLGGIGGREKGAVWTIGVMPFNGLNWRN